jgi:hypothetical protein
MIHESRVPVRLPVVESFLPIRLPVIEIEPRRSVVRRVLIVAALAVLIVGRGLIVPAVARAAVERALPRARFESISVSFLRGNVTLDAFAYEDEKGREFLRARSALAPLLGQDGTLELEDVTLAGELGVVTSALHVDRVALDRRHGELVGFAVRARVLTAEASLRCELTSTTGALEAHFEGAVALEGEAPSSFSGVLHVGPPRAEDCGRPACFELASKGGGFKMKGCFALVDNPDVTAFRDEVDAAVKGLRAFVEDKLHTHVREP